MMSAHHAPFSEVHFLLQLLHLGRRRGGRRELRLISMSSSRTLRDHRMARQSPSPSLAAAGLIRWTLVCVCCQMFQCIRCIRSSYPCTGKGRHRVTVHVLHIHHMPPCHCATLGWDTSPDTWDRSLLNDHSPYNFGHLFLLKICISISPSLRFGGTDLSLHSNYNATTTARFYIWLSCLANTDTQSHPLPRHQNLHNSASPWASVIPLYAHNAEPQQCNGGPSLLLFFFTPWKV